MTEKELYNINLGQTVWVDDCNGVTRVLGGWIYKYNDSERGIITSSIFVPDPKREYNARTQTN